MRNTLRNIRLLLHKVKKDTTTKGTSSIQLAPYSLQGFTYLYLSFFYGIIFNYIFVVKFRFFCISSSAAVMSKLRIACKLALFTRPSSASRTTTSYELCLEMRKSTNFANKNVIDRPLVREKE